MLPGRACFSGSLGGITEVVNADDSESPRSRAVSAPDGAGRLVGGWRLLTWENRASDGRVTHPMGRDPLGYLIYAADGSFSVTISRPRRGRFAAEDLLVGSAEEKATAVEGFVAYAGRYSVEGGRVVHHVELSLFPNWVGTDQERDADLSADTLVLSVGPLLLAGEERIARLVWERVAPRQAGG